jgi:hypothetical protein
VFPCLTRIQHNRHLYPSLPLLPAQEGAMAMADAIPMGLRDGQSLFLHSSPFPYILFSFPLPPLPTIAFSLQPPVAIRSILPASTALRLELMLPVRVTLLYPTLCRISWRGVPCRAVPCLTFFSRYSSLQPLPLRIRIVPQYPTQHNTLTYTHSRTQGRCRC